MKRWGLVLLPAGLGLVAAGLWQQGWWPNPILFARADFGSWIALSGIVVSLTWGVGWALWNRAGIRRERSLTQAGQEQVALRRRFMRRLDHELKNRLTALHAALINLPEESNTQVIRGMRTEVDSLVRLSTDLRKLAELETQPIEQDAVDLAQLLTEVLEQTRQRPEASSRQLELKLPHVPWPLSPVVGDRDLLFLALHNLIDNSLKFSRPGDAIEVRTFEDGPSVAVEVADNGPGIHPEDLPHLGEDLFRGRTTQATPGSGLGLALVRTIVERHAGTLHIRSRLGQGTIVALRFPAARQDHT
ncbi:MAG TPA: HAMP domain-containing sensor histidine kinase [Anaerolineae bacterium]|nr:HAMP domain-containing sensor histidine kinase [Anaerolineae bacterium]